MENLPIKLLLFLVLLALFTSFAYSLPLQSHPLSEIAPIDVNLDMFGLNITNVSYIGIGMNSPQYQLDIVGSGRISSDLIIGNQLIFSGGPTISASNGNLVVSSGLLANGNINMNSYSLFNAAYVNASNIYQNGNQVLDTSTTFSGDVSGTYNNLQLKAGVVGTNELADNAVTMAKISQVSCPSGQALVSIGGGSYSCIKISSASGVINGSGTIGYIPRFIGENTLGDSIMYENNGKIGIGTTNPQQTLDVVGDVNVTGFAQIGSVLKFVKEDQGIRYDDCFGGDCSLNVFSFFADTMNQQFVNNSIIRVGRIVVGNETPIPSEIGWVSSIGVDTLGDTYLATSFGRVGIGTTNPQEKLHVAGSFKAESGGGLVRLDPSGNFWVGI